MYAAIEMFYNNVKVQYLWLNKHVVVSFMFLFSIGCFLKCYTQDGFDVSNLVTPSQLLPPTPTLRERLVFLIDRFSQEMLCSYHCSLFLLSIIYKRILWYFFHLMFYKSIKVIESNTSCQTCFQIHSNGCYVFPITFC